MYAHQDKVRIATGILSDCKVYGQHLFLRQCFNAGIAYGHRDTQDELFEFIEYVCRHVPGSIHAIRKSLCFELRVFIGLEPDRYQPLWKIELILRQFIAIGNSVTAAYISRFSDEILTKVDAEYTQRSTRNNNSDISAELLREYKLTHIANKDVLVSHASAYAPLGKGTTLVRSVERIAEIARLAELLSSYGTKENHGFMSVTCAMAIAVHAGMFMLPRKHITGIMHPRQYWKYRIWAFAAVLSYLGRNFDFELSANIWRLATAGGCNVVEDFAGGNTLPSASEFMTADGIDWSIVAKRVPWFIRDYEEADLYLQAYEEAKPL